MQPVILTDWLSKRYHDFYAVKDLSLSVNKGEIYGFIGLNGAGKTTLIRMLLGMIRPSSGACYLKGMKIDRKAHSILGKVGYIVESPHSYPELTVKENLEISYHLRLVKDPNAISGVMEKLGLSKYADRKVRNLSLGNNQRLGIAKAILHQPEILILDEPVNGLDPAGIAEIRDLLKRLATKKGVTILISSHLLEEVAKIATKIGIIHEGKLVKELKSPDLAKLLRSRLVVDTFQNDKAALKLSEAGYSVSFERGGLLEIADEKALRNPERVAEFLVSKDLSPMHLAVIKENLEEYFLRTIGQRGLNR